MKYDNLFFCFLCEQLSEVFEQEIDPVMVKLGFCCGRKVSKFCFDLSLFGSS